MEKKLSEETRLAVADATPDDQDKINISNLIALYEDKFPYPHDLSIMRSLELGLMETSRGDAVVKKGGMHRALSLPLPFVTMLKRGYPYIFKNKAQFTWFLKNFPMFDLTNPDNEKMNPDKKKGKKNVRKAA